MKQICQSLYCNDKPVYNKNGAEKNVSKKETNCPDCGHVLLWVDGKNRQHAQSKIKAASKKPNTRNKEYFL